MKASKLREQSVSELQQEESKLEEQIFKLRFQFAIGQADNPMKIRLARKDLARVKTVINEKRRAESAPDRQGR